MTAHAYPERLPFRLHDFTRLAWASDRARAFWEPRVNRVCAARDEIEWRSVAAGVRPAALQTVAADRLRDAAVRLSPHGLDVKPLRPAAFPTHYGTMVLPPAGKPQAFQCVIGRRRHAEELAAAYRRNDTRSVGRLLGYPPCCAEFFAEFWDRRGMVDPTWPMAAATPGVRAVSPRHVVVPGPSACGVHLRWLGVRAVSHLPCSYRCAATERVAADFEALAVRHGRAEEAGWLREMLRWPAEWTALHGVAEVKTPVVKVVALTDATADKYTVTYQGDAVPEHAADGLGFPYKARALPLLTHSTGYRSGLENPLPQGPPPPPAAESEPWYAADNGFPSRRSMDLSHRPILARARRLVRESPPAAPGRLLDLGCGNGALARKLAREHPALVPGGVDFDAAKVGRARAMMPDGGFAAADLFAAEAVPAEERYYLAVLMLGRLTEVPAEKSRALLGRLRDAAAHLLVYVYPGYRHAGRAVALPDFAEVVGVELLDAGEKWVSLARPK